MIHTREIKELLPFSLKHYFFDKKPTPKYWRDDENVLIYHLISEFQLNVPLFEAEIVEVISMFE